MADAPSYDVLRFLGQPSGSTYAAEDAHALVAVYRLGQVVSFDRSARTSFSTNPQDGVAQRAAPLYLADEIVHLSVERDKGQHVKSASVTLKDLPLLREVLPGDWALVWLVPDRPSFDDLLARVKAGKAANRPGDGLRLVGRVNQVRKHLETFATGKVVTYQMQLLGFSEFDSQIFYDINVATNDVMQHSVGGWMSRVGVDADAWFAQHAASDNTDNINTIIPEILSIVLGQGVSKELNPGASVGATAASGGGAEEHAANAYVVPGLVGRWLGATPNGSVLAYADLLDVLVGTQQYHPGQGDLANFVPGTQPLLGSFLPMFPQFVNVPFWSVLRQYLNPTINEMYTALRVIVQDGEAAVAPSLVVRQIPFTTDAFESNKVKYVTTFLSLPRWVVPETLVLSSDLGRSDATRCNLVHVYGAASQLAGTMTVPKQMAENPPLRDDLDIQRSGPRPLMQTVECGASAEDVRTTQAGGWMDLVADRSMTSHLTLNGMITCVGLPGPLAEGDNVEVGAMVFHVEGIADTYAVAAQQKTWRTTLRVTNGVLARSDVADETGLHLYGIGNDEPGLDAQDPGKNVMRRTS